MTRMMIMIVISECDDDDDDDNDDDDINYNHNDCEWCRNINILDKSSFALSNKLFVWTILCIGKYSIVQYCS